jgi:hypothetical protein
MGFTGNTFNDTAYTVTGANDGYLFVQGNSSFGGNLVIATGNTGTTKDIVFATGGFLTGNIKARIVDSTGALSVTANVIGGNLTTAGLISSTGNITGGNILTAGILTVTGNIISVANITGGNLLTSGLVSATGNIIGGNISTAGVISATGNITGNYYIGNGSQLTGISATSIANGTSNINIATANGNATVAVNGYSNVAVFGTNSLTLGGPFATPKTINSNVLVANAVNAVLVSPVTIGALGNIFVPDDSTLTIFTPA